MYSSMFCPFYRESHPKEHIIVDFWGQDHMFMHLTEIMIFSAWWKWQFWQFLYISKSKVIVWWSISFVRSVLELLQDCLLAAKCHLSSGLLEEIKQKRMLVVYWTGVMLIWQKNSVEESHENVLELNLVIILFIYIRFTKFKEITPKQNPLVICVHFSRKKVDCKAIQERLN